MHLSIGGDKLVFRYIISQGINITNIHPLLHYFQITDTLMYQERKYHKKHWWHSSNPQQSLLLSLIQYQTHQELQPPHNRLPLIGERGLLERLPLVRIKIGPCIKLYYLSFIFCFSFFFFFLFSLLYTCISLHSFSIHYLLPCLFFFSLFSFLFF